MRIAIQGIKGSNHDVVTRKLFGRTDFAAEELLEAKSFPQLIEAVVAGEADYGVLAVENTVAGMLPANYDLLAGHDVEIVAEAQLRIVHNLIGLEGATLADLKTAYSHEMALRQCEKYLRGHDLEAREYFDTAAAVHKILELGDKSCAAIAPGIAVLPGTQILAAGIETDKANYTRFMTIQRRGSQQQVQFASPNVQLKATIQFELRHKVGSLAAFLTYIASLGWNMTMILSRPVLGKPWDYKFYIDFLLPQQDEAGSAIAAALEARSDIIASSQVLGVYAPGPTYEP